MRVGNRKDGNNNYIDLTPLLDTAFILVFIFLVYVFLVNSTIVKSAKDASVSINEANNALTEENRGLISENKALSDENEALQDRIDEEELENEGLKEELSKTTDELERIKDQTNRDEEIAKSEAFDQIQNRATIVRVDLKNVADKRELVVFLNDENITDRQLVFDNTSLDNATNQLLDLLRKQFDEISSAHIDDPKFIFVSNDSKTTLRNDKKVIYEKLNLLTGEYNNVYIVDSMGRSE